MRKSIATVLLMASVAAAGVQAAGKGAVNSSKKYVEIGKKALAELMNDPESVRFTKLILTESTDAIGSKRTLCGMYNGKNAFGGYGKPELFYVGFGRDGSVEKVWANAPFDNDFRAIDEDIESQYRLGKIGEISKIKMIQEARVSRAREGQQDLATMAAKCDEQAGAIKIVWRQ